MMFQFKLVLVELFLVKIFAEEFSPSNETVGLLLPKLHLNALRAKALHDINAARLRHHLPLVRHSLLLQETPGFLIEDVNVEEIGKLPNVSGNLGTIGNSTNKILNDTEFILEDPTNRVSPIGFNEDILRSDLEKAEKNSEKIKNLLRRAFYSILEQQISNKTLFDGNQTTTKNNRTLSKEGMEFWKIIQENVKHFIKFNQSETVDNHLHGFNENLRRLDPRMFDYLTEMFTTIVKDELDKQASKFLHRTRRNVTENLNSSKTAEKTLFKTANATEGDKEGFKLHVDHLMHAVMHKFNDYIANDTIIDKFYNADPRLYLDLEKKLEPFMLGALRVLFSTNLNKDALTGNCSCEGNTSLTSNHTNHDCRCSHFENVDKKEGGSGEKFANERPAPENEEPKLHLEKRNFEDNRRKDKFQTKSHYKDKKYHKNQRGGNDGELYLQSMDYFKYDDGLSPENSQFERSIQGNADNFEVNGPLPQRNLTHHFDVTHDKEHHPSSFSGHFYGKPFPMTPISYNNGPSFYSYHEKAKPHDHQKLITYHGTTKEHENYLPYHGSSFLNQHHFNNRASTEDLLKQSYIIQAPRNSFTEHAMFRRSAPAFQQTKSPDITPDKQKITENDGIGNNENIEGDRIGNVEQPAKENFGQKSETTPGVADVDIEDNFNKDAADFECSTDSIEEIAKSLEEDFGNRKLKSESKTMEDIDVDKAKQEEQFEDENFGDVSDIMDSIPVVTEVDVVEDDTNQDSTDFTHNIHSIEEIVQPVEKNFENERVTPENEGAEEVTNQYFEENTRENGASSGSGHFERAIETDVSDFEVNKPLPHGKFDGFHEALPNFARHGRGTLTPHFAITHDMQSHPARFSNYVHAQPFPIAPRSQNHRPPFHRHDEKTFPSSDPHGHQTLVGYHGTINKQGKLSPHQGATLLHQHNFKDRASIEGPVRIMENFEVNKPQENSDGFHEEFPDVARHEKGIYPHHFPGTHGMGGHPPSFSNHFHAKPFPTAPITHSNHGPSVYSYHEKTVHFPAPHGHPKPTTYHGTTSKYENFSPHHGNQYHLDHRASNEDPLRKNFIIQVPDNSFGGHAVFRRSVPLLKLIADPNVKLDMPKTIENIGTVAKNSFEDDKAPMYHIRNMVGSAKNVILAALRIAPQDALIPTQYKIMDRTDLKKNALPDVGSRFAELTDEDRFIQTFKSIGLMLRESIKSGQETLQHMTDVAHSARKAVVTTGFATPRFLTPYVKATAIKKDKDPEKLMLITPRIGEVTDRETLPDPTDEYVKIGDLMDAFGVSSPENKKVGLTRFVMHPKKLNAIQSRFGNEQKKRDFFIVAEHIIGDHDKDDSGDVSKRLKKIKGTLGAKSLKDIVGNVREEIQKKSKDRDGKVLSSKSEKMKEFIENLFPLKNEEDLNEIPRDLDEDIEEILRFDWEGIEAIPKEAMGKEIDTSKLKPNQNIDYNELYQKVVHGKNEELEVPKENIE